MEQCYFKNISNGKFFLYNNTKFIKIDPQSDIYDKNTAVDLSNGHKWKFEDNDIVFAVNELE